METKTLANRYILKKILKSENIDEIREIARINLEMVRAIRVYHESKCPVEVFLTRLIDGDIEAAFEETQNGGKDHLRRNQRFRGKDDSL